MTTCTPRESQYIGHPLTRVRAARSSTCDPEPAHTHIRDLIAIGMTTNMIARAAGVCNLTIMNICQRKYPTIKSEVAAAVLTVTPRPNHHQALVMAYGAHRRLEALMFNGHNYATISSRAGQASNWASRIHRAAHIRWANHVAVHEVFDQMAGTHGTCAHMLLRAQRHGYLPALAWDDPDDYTERPNRAVIMRKPQDSKKKKDEARREEEDDARRDRRAEVHRLTETGMSAAVIAVRLGVSQRQVVRDRAYLSRRGVL